MHRNSLVIKKKVERESDTFGSFLTAEVSKGYPGNLRTIVKMRRSEWHRSDKLTKGREYVITVSPDRVIPWIFVTFGSPSSRRDEPFWPFNSTGAFTTHSIYLWTVNHIKDQRSNSTHEFSPSFRFYAPGLGVCATPSVSKRINIV